MSWLQQVVDAGVVRVASAVGIAADARHLQRCPACGAERRSRHDRRAPVNVTGNGKGWRCHASGCSAHGDALTLLAWVVVGEAKPASWRAVRHRAEELGLTRADDVEPRRVSLRRPPPPKPGKAWDVDPRAVEVASAYWRSCWTLSEVSSAVDTVRERGVDSAAVEALDLARARPPANEVRHDLEERRGMAGVEVLSDVMAASCGQAPQAWARGGWDTWGARYGLVLPTYGPTGQVSGVRARALRADARKIKALPCTPAAGVFACPVARWLLSAGKSLRRDVYLVERGLDLVTWSGWIVVREGGPQWLARAAERAAHPETGDAAAVLGVYPGAWTRDHADRIPDWCTVVVATDDDPGGDELAAKIHETLTGRVRVQRYRPPVDYDEDRA